MFFEGCRLKWESIAPLEVLEIILLNDLLRNTFLPFLFLVFFGIGFLATLYYVKHENEFNRPVYSTQEIIRSRGLTDRLHQTEYRNAHLESEVAELNLKIAELFEQQSYIEAQRLARFIGLLQQEGEGVEVMLKDSSKPLLLGDNPNTGIVHNTDLVQVVNELRAAGATAIAINGQPVMGLTAISCSGPIVLINGTRITSPFVIHAMGDSKKISKALSEPTSFIKELYQFGIDAKVTPKQVIIPAYPSQEIAGL